MLLQPYEYQWAFMIPAHQISDSPLCIWKTLRKSLKRPSGYLVLRFTKPSEIRKHSNSFSA
jgi:hypothetical protein